MSEVAEVHSIGAKTLTSRLAARFGVDENKMIGALKATAFNTRDPITNEQMLALCVVAEQYDLNPWTKEIYAFPTKNGGIVPVVGLDGWSRIINSNPEFDGMEFEYSTTLVQSSEHKPCPEWIKCTIHRKDRSHPVSVTEYFDECYQPVKVGKYGPVIGPWQTHTKRFLRHKVTIQCARLAFGFVGIFDPDEAGRIMAMERPVTGEVVRPKGTSIAQTVIDEQQTTADPVKVDEYAEALREAVFNQDNAQINQLYSEMDTDMELMVHRKLSSADRSYIKGARHAD